MTEAQDVPNSKASMDQERYASAFRDLTQARQELETIARLRPDLRHWVENQLISLNQTLSNLDNLLKSHVPVPASGLYN